MKLLATWFEHGVRTIATFILVSIAGLPFSLVFLPFWWDAEGLRLPTVLGVSVFLVLIVIYVPWIGFIFPRILRACWRREQIWRAVPRRAPADLAAGAENAPAGA